MAMVSSRRRFCPRTVQVMMAIIRGQRWNLIASAVVRVDKLYGTSLRFGVNDREKHIFYL